VFEATPGTYELHASASGYTDVSLAVEIKAAAEEEQRLVLSRERPGEETRKGETEREGEADLVAGRFRTFAEARTQKGGRFPSEGRERALEERRSMLDEDVLNRSLRVEHIDQPLHSASFGDLGAWVRVQAHERGRFGRRFLAINYDRDKIGWVDPATIRVFEYVPRKSTFVLVRESGVDVERATAWAHIDGPGTYCLIGLPSHPGVLDTVRAFCRLRDPTDQERRRLCDLVLCSPERRRLAPPGGTGLDACEFCRQIEIPRGGMPECQLLDRPPGPPPGPPPSGPCSWVALGPRNINGRIRAIAVHPFVGDTVFAGTANAGVWSTSDGGQSWKPLMSQEAALEIGALAVHPTDPANPTGDVTIYAGTGEPTTWPGYKGVGIYKSTVSGAPGSWVLTGAIASPGGDRWAVIVVDPTSLSTDPTTTLVWAGGPGGLYRSTNGGGSWTPVQIAGATRAVEDLALDPANPAIVYAATQNGGIYRFDPTSSTWSTFNAGIPFFPQLARIGIGRSAPHTIYAKLDETVYRYDTGSATWVSLGNHGGATYGYWNNCLAVDPEDSNIVVVGGYSVERTYDGGTNWQSPGVGHEDQHAVTFDAGNHLTVWMGNDGGIFRGNYASAADTGTWTKRSFGMTITHFNSLAHSPAGPGVLGSGAQDNGSIRTTGGLTWDKPMGGDGGGYAFDPADPHLMYAQFTTVGVNGHPWKSTDGSGFSPADSGFGDGPFVGKIVLDPNSPPEPNRVLFAAGTNQVMRSSNSAGSWSASSGALGANPSALAVAPTSSAVVYAGTEGGRVYRSADGGTTAGGWQNITTGTLAGSATLSPRMASDIAVHPTDPNTLIVGFSGFSTGPGGHIYRGTSSDGFASWGWQDISSNLPNAPVNAVAVHPSTPSTMWCGTDVGVFETTNGGMSWMPFNNGLPNVIVFDLQIDPAGDVLRAATYGYSSWEIRLAPACPQVDLYVRDNKLDTGESPALSHVPDPTALGASVYWWESADVKTDAYPYGATLVDGIDFDEFAHENPIRQDATHPNPNRLYVQVHNRGPQPTHNVRVKAIWADATVAVPPLPSDFWGSFPTHWTASSPWSEVDPAQPYQSIAQLDPHEPKVLTWSFAIPSTAAEHSCVLIVVSSDEDSPSRSDANPSDHDVSQVAPADKHVALKNLKVLTGGSPPPAGGSPPSRGGVPLGAMIDFNNPSSWDGVFDIVFDHGTLPPATRVSLLLPNLKLRVPLSDLDVPARRIVGSKGWWSKASGIRTRGLRHEIQLSKSRRRDPCTGHDLTELTGVVIGVGERIRGALVFTLGQGLKPGENCRCALIQMAGTRQVGGHTFELRIPPRDVVGPH
jgi:hypothetical protein